VNYTAAVPKMSSFDYDRLEHLSCDVGGTMAENKTKQLDSSVEAFINEISDEARREDCRTILGMMQTATALEPKMWGDSIVAFGKRHYKYATGREGDTFLIGFSPRKQNLTLYMLPYDLTGATSFNEMLGKLGKHKTGKSCLYVKKLADVDQQVLTALVQKSVEYYKNIHI
jgi:hypothetical protein